MNEYSMCYKSANSVRTEKGMIKDFNKFFGNPTLSQITPRRISEYRSHCKARGLAPASIRYRFVFLKHVFKLAITEWEWLDANPFANIRLEKLNNSRDRWLTFDEEWNLLLACKSVSGNGRQTWLTNVVLFALNTGMRQGEILSLKWRDVDLFRKTATVVRSKNGEKRTLPLNRRMFDLFKEKAKTRVNDFGFVFTSETGTGIDPAHLRRAFYRALKAAKIDDFRFHDLRHSFATRLVQAGIDLYKVAKLLGHKDVKMTQRYAHHYPESLRDGVEVLDKISTNPSHQDVVARP